MTAPAAGGAASGPLKVSVTDRGAAQRAGVDGLLLSVAPVDGKAKSGSARVEVNYSSFKGAFGGDWATRLRLVELPECALTTPQEAKCRVTKPVATTNDIKTNTLSATVTVSSAPASGHGKALTAQSANSAGPMVLAATAETVGPTGNYKATPLQASGSWTGGGSSGAFNWNYPINVPSVPGGLQPTVSLGYNSQSVDGRTAASNNQTSWLGDGWDWAPGFIERRYKSCDDDKTGGTNTTKVGDECWFNDNATMSLGGKSTELVYDKDKGGWHASDESGAKIEKLTGASNGDNDGEHWKVTTADGTQYFFGLNHLPGWKDASTPATNSAWTVPVFGNQPGEPCYNASFASAWCQQAWRWQLDYVVDPHGDAMAYYWNTETNNYGRNVSDTTGKSTVTSYVRGGWLDHIDYGLRADSVYSAKAMGQVKFDVTERCLTACASFDETNAKNWPDTPFDLYCKDGATECKSQYAPSFWSRKRLATITTKVLTGGAYKNVDSWALKQDFPTGQPGQDPAAGDGISTPMWLKSITRTGFDASGASVSLPPVTFAGVQRPNRVDKLGDGLAPFVRLRLYQITTESGGTIAVTYSDPDCTASTLPPADATNTTRCYAVKWAFEGETAKQDWFNSYVVTQVLEGDNLASTPDKVTSYSYLDGAAWAKDTDEFTKAEDRGYSVARGYGRVQARTGAANDARTLSEERYFRGLDGAAVKDSAGDAVTDRPEFAGMKREEATYNGDDTSKLVSATSYTPWRSDVTASRPRTGLPDLTARFTGTSEETKRTTVTGGVRKTKTTRAFDEYGMVTSESDTGDVDKPGDEKCVTTEYARNKDKWILDAISRTRTVAVPCGTTPGTGDVVDDVRKYYDNGALGAGPTQGDITKSERINGSGDGYDTVTSVTGYDIYGRELSSTDAYGKPTSTAYTPATGEVPTKKAVTNTLGHVVTASLDPLRGQTTQSTDANGKVTTSTYDALGRLAKVWLPTRSAAVYPDSPNYAYDYLIRNDGPTVVTTKALDENAKYKTSYAFYDGMLRPVQTQQSSRETLGTASAKRLVTETLYDTRGLAWRSSGTYVADGSAEPVLVTGQELKYPASTDTEYDGAGRPTAVIFKKFGDETKRTTTSYTGDTTTVVPPQGGVASTTVTDALGRKTELKEYTDAARTHSQSTTYSYNKLGRLAEVTDPSGAKWTYVYDVRGRQIQTDDPDKGTVKTTFDQGDRATDVTDARGITLHTDYDALGRKTALKNGTTVLSSWAYDSVAKGQLAKATRYVDGQAYETAITSYNSLNQPVNTQVTIPAAEGALAGTYKWTTSYDLNTGKELWTKQPALGDLPAETVTTKYDANSGQPKMVGAGSDALLADVTYDYYGRGTIEKYGSFGQQVTLSNAYDDHTSALTDTYVDKDTAPQRVEDSHYKYDQAGNVTSISTSYGQDATRTTDNQCFAMDGLLRITNAWTAKADCSTAPSDATVGGPDAYWSSYSYDALGNRQTETQHKTASGPVADTVRAYGAPTAAKHDLPKVTQSGTNPHEETYAYDKAGNTTSRSTATAGPQSLTWDAEGHLATVTQNGAASSYLYDTEGQRLERKDSTGATLYLPDGNELLLTKTGSVTGTRYYSAGGKTMAARSGGKLSFLVSDPHGTNTTQITADSAQTVSRRKSTIFGAARGDQAALWAGDKGFVGGTKDADAGLVHLGARDYDPLLGRFISVDPLFVSDDPRQFNPYAYSNNNPVSFSDPTGTQMEECRSGMYTCETSSHGTTVTGYGNNYESVVEQVRGTPAPHYIKYKQKVQRACSKDPDCKSWNGSHASYSNASVDRDAAEREKQQEAKKAKKGGWGSLAKGLRSSVTNLARGDVGGALGSLGDTLYENRHWLIDKGVGYLAMLGTAACIAATACVAAYFLIGAAALAAVAIGAHRAAASEDELSGGVGEFVPGVLKAEATGVVAGALCGRGFGGCLMKGAKNGTPLAGVERTALPSAAVKHVGRTLKDWLF
ncbi:RHS repeat-associated core domain-containing protein [Streptomyces hundungensis]|uniref:RHS repeat domain-containing protein n=1 Tax=Streptomyces hundungensis TaxID=1077946 RepID=UPI0033DBCB26